MNNKKKLQKTTINERTTMKKTMKIFVGIPLLLLLLIIGGTYTFNYLSYAHKERAFIGYMAKYNKLGVNLSMIQEYCTNNILEKIPQAELILQSMVELSNDMPKDSPYRTFVLKQMRNKLNETVANRINSSIKLCFGYMEKQKNYKNRVADGTKIEATLITNTIVNDTSPSYPILAIITKDVWDSSREKILFPKKSVVYGITNFSPLMKKIIIVWDKLIYAPDAKTLQLTSKIYGNERFAPFITTTKGRPCGSLLKNYCLQEGTRITIGVNQDFSFNDPVTQLAKPSDATQFHDCILAHADFTNAQLKNTSFERCNLSGIKLNGADLSFAVFKQCQENGRPITKKWLLAQGAKNIDSTVIEP